jgi:hypothetical protein
MSVEPSFGRAPADVAAALRERGVDAHLAFPRTPRSVGRPGREDRSDDGGAARALALPMWDGMRVDDLESIVRSLRACRFAVGPA